MKSAKTGKSIGTSLSNALVCSKSGLVTSPVHHAVTTEYKSSIREPYTA